MTREIRLYVEGGGDGPDGKAKLRQGLAAFLQPIVERCRRASVRWSLVACGSRTTAHDMFCNALQQFPSADSFLLVDAEEPVHGNVWEHLARREGDRWKTSAALEGRYHLMVLVMESWLVSDPDTLERYYGKGFRRGALPATRQIEGISKADLARALKAATEGTRKGEYHKIRHGPELLGLINRDLVRRASPYCDRLFRTLEEHLAR